MWTDSVHRFASEAAFLAACDAAGWPRGPDGQPSPPAGVALDVFGPAIEPPTLAGPLVTPGAVDPRWHVVAAWFSGVIMPAELVAAEIVPEQPLRVLADRDPTTKLARIKTRFDLARTADRNDPRLVPKRVTVEVRGDGIIEAAP